MPKKMNIILLSPYLPSLYSTAFARKVYDNVRLLSQRGHSVFLASFCSSRDEKDIAAISRFCAQAHIEKIKDYAGFPARCPALTSAIRRYATEFSADLLQCEQSYMIRYLPQERRIPLLLVEHEILSASFAEKARFTRSFPARTAIHLRKIKKYAEEKHWYNRVDRVIVFSEYDRDLVARMSRNRHRVQVVPLGIDISVYPRVPAGEKQYDMILVGNFSHAANVDAAAYFKKSIFPLIRNKLEAVRLIMAGRDMPVSLREELSFGKGIVIAGAVEDIMATYAQSKIAIVPVRFGTGMRYKVLEAMAMEVPVVTTRVGARGLICPGEVIVADTPEDFAAAAVELLNDPLRQKDLAGKGRESVIQNYSWDKLISEYEHYYDILLDG